MEEVHFLKGDATIWESMVGGEGIFDTPAFAVFIRDWTISWAFTLWSFVLCQSQDYN